MKQLSICILACAMMLSPLAAQEKDTPPTIKDLHRLVGTWEIIDGAVENTGGEFRETGIRECAYTLHDNFILCESNVTSDGVARTFLHYYNYNRLEERFEMLAMWSNHNRKMLYHVRVSDDGRRLDLTSGPNPEASTEIRRWSTITFKTDDHMVRETRLNRSGDMPDHWPVLFQEDARRIDE